MHDPEMEQTDANAIQVVIDAAAEHFPSEFLKIQTSARGKAREEQLQAVLELFKKVPKH